jgi:hypothetical protein
VLLDRSLLVEVVDEEVAVHAHLLVRHVEVPAQEARPVLEHFDVGVGQPRHPARLVPFGPVEHAARGV